MNAEKKPRKRLEKLVSGVKEKLKRAKRAPRVKVEPIIASTSALSSEEKLIDETISRRAVIAGYITDDHTKQTISGAAVELAGQNLQTVTRGDGFFYFLHPPVPAPEGQEPKLQYTLKVSVPHLDIYYGETTVENIEVQNEPNGRPMFDVRANVGLKSTSLIGQVIDDDTKQPIEKAKLELLGSNIQTLTGPDGKYALFGLQRGKPTVRVSAEGYEPVSPKVELKAGEQKIVNFSLIKRST